MGFYVDISDVPLDFLEFMGYTVEAENETIIVLNRKGDHHIVLREGTRYLHVEDPNDAEIFAKRRMFKAPPRD